MKIGYFDCFSGAAGDMLLASLIDAGWSIESLESLPQKLGLNDVAIQSGKVSRHGIAATHIDVVVSEGATKNHRHLSHILKMIEAADLPTPVKTNATRVFQRLAEAEAFVHGTTLEKVHFHEVGANDAIVDIVGVCLGIHELGIEKISCSPLPTGSGTVKCDHGIMPVPAPATAKLLEGFPLADCDEKGELTTPTGAALLTTLSEGFGPLPAIKIARTGVGAGTRESATRANILRVFVGEKVGETACEQDVVSVLEAQVDDTTGQQIAFAIERLLGAGALDAFAQPIVMKKGRPAHLLTVLCRPADVSTCETILFAETRTLGIRRHSCQRSILARTHVSVTTPFGDVRIKVGKRGDEVVQAWPEYDDCVAVATATNVSLKAVQDAAITAYQNGG